MAIREEIKLSIFLIFLCLAHVIPATARFLRNLDSPHGLLVAGASRDTWVESLFYPY